MPYNFLSEVCPTFLWAALFVDVYLGLVLAALLTLNVYYWQKWKLVKEASSGLSKEKNPSELREDNDSGVSAASLAKRFMPMSSQT